jgi:hypothetical protein
MPLSALPPDGSKLLPASGVGDPVVIATGGGTGFGTTIAAEQLDLGPGTPS